MSTAQDRRRLSGRSAVSNGKRLFASNAGIDYRTLAARRFKDLVRSYSETYDVVTEADQSLVRTAASLAFKGEQMQEALVRGENVESDEIVKNAGQLHRILAGLKRRAAAGADARSPSLQDHITVPEEGE